VSARFCTNCGTALIEGERFCPNCGSPAPATVATATEAADEQAVNWRALEAIGVFIVSLIATLIFTLPFALALRPAANCDTFIGSASHTCQNHRDMLLAIGVGLNELALLGTVLLWVRLIHKRSPRALGFRRFTAKNAFTGVGIGLAGVVVALTISQILIQIVRAVTNRPVDTPHQIPVSAAPAGGVLVIIGFSVIVLAPLAEEAFFRGFLFQGIRRWARPATAIVLSAAIFGLAHLIPLIMLPIFGLGVLLAAIVEKRASLVPSIFAHATFNAIGFVQLYHAHLKPF
jgi:membrane protease YdiL (CAAX protease family)